MAVTAWRFGGDGLAADLAEQGRIAEQIGFDSFWLPESHFTEHGAVPAPLMLLATIAAVTTKLKLGSTSYLLPIRHPIHAAEEVAVLDRLSGGRVILGVGRGFRDAMFAVFDIPSKSKRALFQQNLDIMIDAWQGNLLPGSSPDEPVYLSPLPVQSPYPPIWVAAFGPLALKQAGSLGLPYIASPVETLESLDANYKAHRDVAIEAGHSTIDTVPVMRTLLISEDDRLCRDVKDALAAEVRHRMREEDADPDQWTIVGSKQYVTEKIAEYQETLGLNYLIARGRIPGVSNDQQVASHEQLAQLSGL